MAGLLVRWRATQRIVRPAAGSPYAKPVVLCFGNVKCARRCGNFPLSPQIDPGYLLAGPREGSGHSICLMEILELNGQALTLAEIEAAATGCRTVALAPEARQRIAEGRALVERILAAGQTVYGVNTGFGKLSDVRIPADKLQQLQANLVRSHAGGMGEPLSIPEARAMLLLRANVLAKGFSGCRPEAVELLIALLNSGVTPVIPEKGSVGASGDLAPLAHLALVVIGEGEAWFAGERISGADALRRAGLRPLTLDAKEGLALLNGTQAMTAVGALAVARGQRLARLADVAGAMSLEALMGTPAAFDPRIHQARPHEGQIAAARHLTALMAGSEIRESHREHDIRVQDAYCLRCMPQVHGAVRDALAHVTRVLEVEAGSATDNPLVFPGTGPDAENVLSGGNFHGAPLAYALDYAAIVLTDLAGIAERRIDRLLNPDINEGLPAFLSPDPGLSSGFMIAQIGAAALINECQVLSAPASTGTIPTDGGKEDHVSMGMTGALKLRRIAENVERVVAIELMCAAQGLEFRRPLKAGPAVEAAHEAIRTVVPRLGADRVLAGDIAALAAAVRGGAFDDWCA
jgi:histidine ammonia-lyase